MNQNLTGELSVYDLSGKQVKVLHEGSFAVGENRFNWSGDDENQNPVAPGMYLIRLCTNKSISTIRVQKI
jgi:flagellar hook assembly protein FlgD